MKSISDWLIKQGFEPNYTRDCFEKCGVFGYMTEIPFSSLAGHTITTFKTFAQKKNWINEDTELWNVENIGQSLGLYVGLNLISVSGDIHLEPWGSSFITPSRQYERARIYNPGSTRGIEYVTFECMSSMIFYGFLICTHPINGKIIHLEDFYKPAKVESSDMLHVGFNLDNIKLNL